MASRAGRTLSQWLAPPVPAHIHAALQQAQYQSVRKQVPMLLGVAAINTAILMAVCAHEGLPLRNYAWMSVLIGYCAVRILFWTRQWRGAPSADRIPRLLRMNVIAALGMISVLGLLTSVTFAAGTFQSMLLVPMSLGFGAASIAHCLYTLRPAAIGTIIMGMGPSSLTMLAVGPFEAQMLGVAMFSVGMLMIRFVVQQYDQLINNLELAEENRRLAHVDSLTGLANRRAVMAALDEAAQDGEGFGVALIDLDGFKAVNDTHGHAAGDALLRTVATRLETAVAAPDLVGRLGGDEFIVILRNAPDDADLARRGNGLLIALCRPVTLGDRPVRFGASLGFARHDPAAGDIESMLHAADEALYAAKRRALVDAGALPHSARRRA